MSGREVWSAGFQYTRLFSADPHIKEECHVRLFRDGYIFLGAPEIMTIDQAEAVGNALLGAVNEDREDTKGKHE